MNKKCGSCSACCKVMKLETFEKPAMKWCQYACGKGGGCEIYNDRPQECKSFNCAWLFADWMTDDLRPDRCGAVLSIDRTYEKCLHVHPTDFRIGLRPRVVKLVNELASRGGWIVLIATRLEADGKTSFDIMGSRERVQEYGLYRMRKDKEEGTADMPAVLKQETKNP